MSNTHLCEKEQNGKNINTFAYTKNKTRYNLIYNKVKFLKCSLSFAVFDLLFDPNEKRPILTRELQLVVFMRRQM